MSTLKLVVEAGPDAGRQFDIKPDGASIGRSTQNDRKGTQPASMTSTIFVSDQPTLNPSRAVATR